MRYRGDDAVRAVVAEHGGYIGEETLALSIEEGTEEGEPPDATASAAASLGGHEVTLAVRKA